MSFSQSRPLAGILVFLLAAFAQAADETDANIRYLKELRREGKSAQAETACRRALARPDLKDNARARLTVELSQMLADRAIAAPPTERDALWTAADETLITFQRNRPDSPSGILVQLQSAINANRRGEIARLEAEAAGESRRSFDAAKRSLREAARRFEAVHALVEAMLQARTPVGDFSREELVNLEKSARHHRAKSLMDLARCFPSDSPDRIDLLGQASRLLAPLAGGDGRHPLTWRSRIDRIRSERLLGHHDQAGEQLRALLTAAPPEETRFLALAESMRLALDAGRLDDAVAALGQIPRLETKHPRPAGDRRPRSLTRSPPQR